MIGKTVYISAKKGEVIGEEVGKRGRALLIVRMADGSERKVDRRSIEPAVEFAPADASAFSRPTRDYYGDTRRMFRR